MAFDRRLPVLETAGDPAPAAAASGVPSTNIAPHPIFVTLRPRQVRFLPEWTGPTTTITAGGQPAYDFAIAWKIDEGTATAHSDFEYVDWATQSNNDLAAAHALPRAEVWLDTSGAAIVSASARSGVARRKQEV